MSKDLVFTPLVLAVFLIFTLILDLFILAPTTLQTMIVSIQFDLNKNTSLGHQQLRPSLSGLLDFSRIAQQDQRYDRSDIPDRKEMKQMEKQH